MAGPRPQLRDLDVEIPMGYVRWLQALALPSADSLLLMAIPSSYAQKVTFRAISVRAAKMHGSDSCNAARSY